MTNIVIAVFDNDMTAALASMFRRAAKALGPTIPPSLLQRTDQVIE